MRVIAGVDGQRPTAQSVRPVLRRIRKDRRRPEADIDHGGDDLIPGADVPVRRHCAHAQALGELAHRHAFQAFVVRERDTRKNDLADVQPFALLPFFRRFGCINFPEPPHPLGRDVRIGVRHFPSSSTGDRIAPTTTHAYSVLMINVYGVHISES